MSRRPPPRVARRGWPVALLLAACASTATPTTTTAPPTTTTAPTTTTTTPPTTTTTTLPVAAISVTIPGDALADRAVSALYGWLGDRQLPTPDVPVGLLEHVEATRPAEDLALTGVLTSAALPGGRVGVVMVDDDVILLADEGAGWRVVGARLTRYGLDPWYGPPVRHVLVIGTDARPGESQRLYRADSIHVLSSNLAQRAGAIIGFPRDTLVATSYGQDKFTHVNASSERHTDEMVDIARDLSGLPIEGYVITGFVGFIGIVNDIGGVIVDVPYAIFDVLAEAALNAGTQRLWGAGALGYSRARHIPGGDFTRSRHQGEVMLAALAVVRQRPIADLPALLAILLDRAWTDLTPGELLTLAAGAFELDAAAVANVVVPGEATLVSGAAVVILDAAAAEELFADAADGWLTPED